ncbi:hypothetical protein ACIQ1D_18755 [Lysinibacillus xylanilyticus]|uniref:hypothetical protein n=1 Tax=Lysinibacillus xylanilyticus TaxID=582475 RepID=UPI0038201830
MNEKIEGTFDGLPEQCWGVLNTTNELILIKRGIRGYFPQEEENAKLSVENVDMINKRNGVTKGQRKAMENGSIFGWSIPASNPAIYDDFGDLKEVNKLKNPRWTNKNYKRR